ncbi:MAG: 16S rRNA processing protein RimM [Calditrichaeota bacterium]|nr:16S rRNA processing protein RimM [Calditrichota bacterium]
MKSSEDLITVGVIIKPHGITGEVKVLPTTDDPKRFSLLNRVFLRSPQGEQVIAHVLRTRYHRDALILQLDTCQSRVAAEQFRNWDIQIPREECLPLPEGRYYIFDLVGLQAKTLDGQFIGMVKDVLTITNNDVFVIETPAHKDVLVPFVEEFVKSIDIDKGVVLIQPIEGLLE